MTSFVWRDGGVGAIEIGGVRLEASSHGPPPDEAWTLVLLHEGLGCVALWRDFPARLAEATGFGVFAYSRAGYGRSEAIRLPRPRDHMTREAVDVLPGVLDAVGLKRGVLLGHSDGATIAAIHAGSVEDFRVRGLILMAPHFFCEDCSVSAISAAREAFETGDLRARLAKYHGDVEGAFRGWCEAWLDPAFRSWNVADVIDYWRVPALAIQGEGDPYGTLAQIREMEMRAYSPVDVEILSDCKHQPHFEWPEATLSAIADFCSRLERIERAGVEVR